MHNQLLRSSSNSGEISSQGQFTTNSNPRLLEESFGDRRDLGQSYHQCFLCSCKKDIMKQLWVLKQAVEAKNKKILELQEFIHRLSQMVLSQNNQLTASATHIIQLQNKLNTSPSQSSHKPYQSSSNSSNLTFSQPQSISKDSKLKESSFKSEMNQELTAFESEYAKSQIKKHIQKMSLRKPGSEDHQKSNMSRESNLKKKLNEIMNHLPSSSRESGLRQFQSMSEPLNQGSPGILNERPGLKIASNWNNTPRGHASNKYEQSQVLQQSKCRLTQ